MGETYKIKKVTAPYNFVPFSNHIIQRYKTPEELPRHDMWDPSLLSGEIKVTFTAQTPVFISNGAKGSGQDDSKVDFFRGADGHYTIPGSTIRGLIRQNMCILGLGLIRNGEDFKDYKILYRDFASAGSSLAKDRKRIYRARLDIRNGVKNVHGGYLHHEGENYWIQPVKGEVLFVPKRIKVDAKRGGKETKVNPIVAQWVDKDKKNDKSAFKKEVWYRTEGKQVSRISTTSIAGYRHGMLMAVGKMSGQNHLYLFPDEDPEATAIHLTKGEIIDYQEDFENRKNTLGGEQKQKFWMLPESGACKPVFYMCAGGVTSFGMSRYLRIAYAYPVSDGLPQNHKDEQSKLLDYPYAMMGFVGEKNSYRSRISVGDFPGKKVSYRSRISVGDFPGKKVSYRSRVSVGDFPAIGKPTPEKPVRLVLGEPKLSFYPGYVNAEKNNPKHQLDYNNHDFQLRGIKQYWLKDVSNKQPTNSNPNVATILRPLPKGTSFTGTIRYQNLHEDELGLLLWCIRLDEGCFQSVGMGKPYGYGRMSVQIDAIWERNPDSLYGSITGEKQWKSNPSERVDELIGAYDQEACRLGNIKQKKQKKQKKEGQPSLRELPSIQDFFYLKQFHDRNPEEISYMDLKDYQNVEKPLDTVRSICNNAKKGNSSDTPAAQNNSPWAVLSTKKWG